MKKSLNIGIIGTGIVSERIINAVNNYEDASIVGIYDISHERLKVVMEKYNLKGYMSHNELLDDNSINLVYLAVPPKFHYPIGLDILKSNKHFLCEKPLANSTKEAREMYEIATGKNMVHAMNFPTV